MATKFIVSGVKRPGYDGAFYAHKHWPAGGVEVELVDQDEDPPDDPALGRRIGKKTLEGIKNHSLLNIRAPGDPVEVARDASDAQRLREENAQLRARIAELEGQTPAPAVVEEKGRKKTA